MVGLHRGFERVLASAGSAAACALLYTWILEPNTTTLSAEHIAWTTQLGLLSCTPGVSIGVRIVKACSWELGRACEAY